MQTKQSYIKWILRCFSIVLIAFSFQGYAQNRTINLTVAYKTVNFTGKKVRAIAVNNQIPGPTLHFKEGDHVTINVHNHLDQGTTIHWHGLIVPWKMDGVEGVTQKAIPPGAVFHYQFTLHQYGSYWYHAHSKFQEQQGLYGGLIIDPPKQKLHYNKNFEIVLSDWNDAAPAATYANLKKDGDFYSINFPMQPSLAQFFHDYHSAKTQKAKEKISHAYGMMQTTRMGVYDLSDVSYDAYLLNGHTKTSPWTKRVKKGDVVRLRFVGAPASTIFHVKIPGASMLMVQADGNDIKPYTVNSFSIAPGETFDVLVKIKENHPYVIYAESIDSLGTAIGVLKTQAKQVVSEKYMKPFPKPGPIMMKMKGHTMHQGDAAPLPVAHTKKSMHPDHHMHHQHGAQHAMTAVPLHMKSKTQAHKSLSSKSQYDNVQSPVKTNNPNIPVHVINMKLSGYMDRYIWFLNDVPFYKAKPIMIKHGQRYRIIFTNKTMMHHPMHIHGHWFILRNGHGTHDPKLHTIDVPPGATIVADIDANETGQWFFHCHNLIHMKAGMANIFRYEETPKKELIGLSGNKKIAWYTANELELSGDFAHQTYEGTLHTLIGSDYNKLQLYSKDAEIDSGKLTDANIDIFYWRLINQFWAVKGGVNYVYRPAATPYVQPGIGIEGLMPYFIKTDLRSYLHDGSAKLDVQLTRDTQITHRIFLELSAEGIFATKTIEKDEIGSGLNSLQWTIQPYYQVNPNVALFIQYQNTENYGTLKTTLSNEGESTQENTYSIGASFLF
ncbi:MAG: hypothetical protein DHS20C10_14040 [marine bacterium B5-7]|nr:MAG: hypothetical protein DHS20C10_14040 [marine bacterium B5-7]